MLDLLDIPGLRALQRRAQYGMPDLPIAVLDGPVDNNHPCFENANSIGLSTLVSGKANVAGAMSVHGTHIASILFGQPDSTVSGLVPRCQGLFAAVFTDDRRQLSQLDLARAIEQAAESGARVINISGGSLTDSGEAEDWLERAVKMCRDRNILIVAAAGNDGCDCLHVPAALPAVLAVGATDRSGKPLDFSNWGETYQRQGLLAPGENILGARPGGGTQRLSGTSFAAPIVTGVAALLLSLQLQQGKDPDPLAVREALLASALPCNFAGTENDRKCLAGVLNIPGAIRYLTGETMPESANIPETSQIAASSDCSCSPEPEIPPIISAVPPDPDLAIEEEELAIEPARAAAARTSTRARSSQRVTPSQFAEPAGGIVYAIGTLGYDFGTEARRDSFKQLMPAVAIADTLIPANPYDARQMVDYLGNNLSEAQSLIWTLNLELTPIYAIEPLGSFSREVYGALQELLAGQVRPEDEANYIERVSIPGILTGRTARLFSGQIVPIVEPQSPRGIYGWAINTLIEAALAAVSDAQEANEAQIRRSLESFLNRIYYDLRNLGQISQDRALNFAATNVFQATEVIADSVRAGMELDCINVQKSPFCRLDSDCWDVQLKFFDPENNRRAKRVYRYTIDVSDLIPVSLGEVRTWSSAD